MKYEYGKPIETFQVNNGEVKLFSQSEGFSLRGNFKIRKIEYSYDLHCIPNADEPLKFKTKDIRRTDGKDTISSIAYDQMDIAMSNLHQSIIFDRQDLIDIVKVLRWKSEYLSNLKTIEDLKRKNLVLLKCIEDSKLSEVV